MRFDQSEKNGSSLALGFIVVLAAGLRFYHLGTPAQWMDEILVPQNASHPLGYIWELCRGVEVHPPLYYGLIKVALAISRDDAVLRLASAVCGVGAVWATYLLGRELLDRPLGLFAAAFAAINPHALLLSRYIRPYSLMLLFYTFSLYFLVRFLNRRDKTSFALVVACDALVFSTHNIAPFLLGAQVVVLAGAALAERSRGLWVATAALAGVIGALTGVEWFVFMRNNPHVSKFLENSQTVWESLRVLGGSLAENVFAFESAPARAAFSLLALAGLVGLWRASRRAAVVVLVFLVFSPLALLVTGNTWNLYSRHLCQVIAPVCVLLGAALRSLRPLARRAAATSALVALLGAAGLFSLGHANLYEVDSYRNRVIGTNYRVIARHMQDTLQDGDALVVSNDYFRNGLNWYADQMEPPNRMRSLTLTPETKTVRVKVLANLHYGSLAKNPKDFADRYLPRTTERLEENVRLFTLAPQKREPVFTVWRLPQRIRPPMDLLGFFRRVARLERADYFVDARGSFVMAAGNNVKATVEYRFDNQAGPGDQTVILNFAYRNFGRDNHIVVETRFDDEPPVNHPLSLGPDPHGQGQVTLERDRAYRTLAVRVGLVCAPVTPLFPGQNYETLRFEGLDAAFCAKGASADCRDEMRNALLDNALDNYRSEGFLRKSRVEQRVLSVKGPLTNVADSGGKSGWTRCVPGAPDGRAVLELAVDADRDEVFAFPRVGEGSLVALYQLDATGRREERLFLRGRKGQWTPIAARYPVKFDPSMAVDGKYRVEIVLQGKGAQMWNKDDVFFW